MMIQERLDFEEIFCPRWPKDKRSKKLAEQPQIHKLFVVNKFFL